MKWFHGTSTKYLDAILRDGIQPRNITGVDAVDRFECGSDSLSAPNNVYFSRDSARYAISTPFADNEPMLETIDGQAPITYAPVLLEVDSSRLDESNFRPDEDWLSNLILRMNCLENGSALDISTPEGTKARRQIHSRICDDMSLNSQLWQLCLEHSGCVAHFGAIPPAAISRVSVLPMNKMQFVELALLVECNCLCMPLQAQTRMYQAVLKWMLGHSLSIDDWVPHIVRLSNEQRRRIMNLTKVRPTLLPPGEMLARRDTLPFLIPNEAQLRQCETSCAQP